jgi:hypothetical protein
VLAELPVCPDIVTVSPTANPLAPAVCITVVLVVLDAVLDVTAVVMDGAVDAPLLLLPVQSVSSIFVVIGSLPEGQRRDSHPGPVKNTSKKKKEQKKPRDVYIKNVQEPIQWQTCVRIMQWGA